jgi:NADP-dependent 3-hydroxy acid dehydrogenase YdfG
MTRVNCDGAFHLARATLPHLRASAGNLVFVGSIAGEYPRPFNPVYAATKWWTRGFAHSLAAQVGDEDVAVTTVNPSEVRTEFFSEEGTPIAERHEPGSVSEPEDVAAAIVFAARQQPPNTVHELDLYRRDKLSHF